MTEKVHSHCAKDLSSLKLETSSFKLLETIETTLNEGLIKAKLINSHHTNNSKHINTNKPPDVSQRTFLSDEFETDDVYKYLNTLQDNTLLEIPWKQEPYYFQTVYVSMLAMLKMTTHAISGGSIEIMGMLLGYYRNNEMFILDCYPLPVQGTESRVNPQNDSYEFMLGYLTKLQQSGVKKENILGWYHSHPGFGCWLSGIDVQTQKLHQGFEDPYVAIVIDPIKSLKEGIVNIGAFRTFYDSHKDFLQSEDNNNINNNNNKEMGWHLKEYYSLNVKLFVTELDKIILSKLDMNKVGYSKLVVDLKNDNNLNVDYEEGPELDADYNSIKIWEKINGLFNDVSINLHRPTESNNDIDQASICNDDIKSTQNDFSFRNSFSDVKDQNLVMKSTPTAIREYPKKAEIVKTGVEMDMVSTEEIKQLLIREIQRIIFS
jgi:COP9 signalosome complex subunit 5